MQSKYPISLPTFDIRNIQSEYEGKSETETREKLKELKFYNKLVDRYIEHVYEEILNEPYLSRSELVLVCSARLFETYQLPPPPQLKDNGKYSDDFIILSLVQYVKRVKQSVERFNDKVKARQEEYNKRCVMQ